jgi:7,8-dihydropterin-6-yl-methyl-4-(beta-D-ribofuranosyl)aminobenzene 5'-phosphate synthase
MKNLTNHTIFLFNKFKLILLLIGTVFGIFAFKTETPPGKIIVLYDNYQFTENTRADWGFACLIIKENDTILFDTGAKADILFHNLKALNIDITTIQTLVISHHHGDHAGNIFPILEANSRLQVFLPTSLDGNFRQMVGGYGVRNSVESNIREIAHNIFLSGEMGFQIREQALVIKTRKGLIVISACGHPGIDRMVSKISRKFNQRVYRVIGGFHLEGYSEKEVQKVIDNLIGCGVSCVAPGHCTGEKAIELFRQTYQDGFVPCGTGQIFKF